MTVEAGDVASRPIFLGYSQADLDRAYDQRAWAANAAEVIARYAAQSAEVRRTHPHHADLAYGQDRDELLDWFPGPGAHRPVHIHLHGGAWRALGKSDASFAAPAFTTQGVDYVVPHFTNLPAIRLPGMVEQVARAVAFVHARAVSFGADPDRIFISGHSSGAHLAAVLLTRHWEAQDLPADLLKGAVLVAGIYDLEPVMLSSRRSYVVLDKVEQAVLSPARHAAAIRCPVTIAYGGRESPEFIRQARSFAGALCQAGRLGSLLLEPDLNHFEIAEELGRKGSRILGAALEQVASPSAPTARVIGPSPD